MNTNQPCLPNRVGRREFLRAATATVAVEGTVLARERPAASPPVIPHREFGHTGRRLPVLAFGGAALVNRWGSPLTVEQRVELVRYAFERGIRYFDTASNYGESQKILGKALKDVRSQVFLVSKVETTEPANVRAAVENCLDQLQTNYLDAILIHGTPGLEQMSIAQAMKIHDQLARLREEKITQFVGFSAHSYFDKALALIRSGQFDLCMLSYGYLSRGYNQIHSQRMIALRDTCIAEAHRRGMGIAAMKVIAGGVLGSWATHIVPDFDKTRLSRLPGAAIRYVLRDPRIHLLVIGMRLKKEIDANINVVANNLQYTFDDQALLAEFTASALESPILKRMKVE